MKLREKKKEIETEKERRDEFNNNYYLEETMVHHSFGG